MRSINNIIEEQLIKIVNCGYFVKVAGNILKKKQFSIENFNWVCFCFNVSKIYGLKKNYFVPIDTEIALIFYSIRSLSDKLSDRYQNGHTLSQSRCAINNYSFEKLHFKSDFPKQLFSIVKPFLFMYSSQVYLTKDFVIEKVAFSFRIL